MKQLLTVLRFEYVGYLRRKSYILVTIIMALIMAGVLFWPRISQGFDLGGGGADVDTRAIALLDRSGTEGLGDELSARLGGMGYRLIEVSMTREQLEDRVDAGEYESAIVLTGPQSYTRIALNIGMYDSLDAVISAVLGEIGKERALIAYGLSPEQASAALNAQVTGETVTVTQGKNQMQSFFYTYALIFVLYFAILMYGQFVATSVATEKSTRTMELLITSAKPGSLMFGKVYGAGLAGFTQLAVMLGTAFVSYNINISYYEDNFIIQSIFAMPVSIVGYLLVFFVLGFFIYAFLYAALSSLVSRMEDLNTAVSPVMMVFMAAFMVVMFSMAGGNVDSGLMVVCSFIPLTSPMAMFARIAMSIVPPYEIILSVALLIASTAGIGLLSAAIYRLGVLLYGNPPKPGQIVKMLKNR